MSDSTPYPKQCTACSVSYPDAQVAFSKNKRTKDGYSFWCKKCHRTYEDKNRERINANKRAYIDALKATPERFEKFRQQQVTGKRRYRASAHGKERGKQYRAENRDKRTQYNRQWLSRNPHFWDQYRKAHPEYKLLQKVYRSKRRALVVKNGGSHSASDIRMQYRQQNGKCWWCSKAVGDNYHADHRIPLNKGGSNDASNICISCPSCNLQKQDKMPWEYNGRLL